MTEMTVAEWHAEAIRRFGKDHRQWRFVCPSCGHVARVQDWVDASAAEGEYAFSCVGRHMPHPAEMYDSPGPCCYAGGGLFKLNPVEITWEDGNKSRVFAFAEVEP